MIRATLGQDKPQPKKNHFPKLMIHEDGTITLFFMNRYGIHLYVPEDVRCEVGFISDSINMEEYTEYNESITLQNA